MSVTFGMMLCDQHPETDDMHLRFNELVEQVRTAHQLGYRTIVSGQHFLADPMQMLQTVPILARLAAEGPGMRFGTCVLLLSNLNPVAVAEDIATLDIMTGGRTFMGVALGYRDVEFDAFGVEKHERVRRFETNIETVAALLEGKEVSLDEPWCRIDGKRMTLRPMQDPRPPIWVGANADKALRRAARLGDTWIINPHARLDTLTRQMNEVYLPALKEFDRPTPSELPIRREIFVGEDRADAFRRAAPWLMPKYATYTSWGQDKALPSDDDFPEEAEALIEDRFILGSPEECIREIDRYREQLGVTEFIVRVQWNGMPQELAMENLKRLGETIIPHYAKPGN
jgi:alkanesulfonate monooxygenase SsuD/methylene tetrahydromethanopterin reductase-like flavin-dependent oxidoreductase (luciferase family)